MIEPGRVGTGPQPDILAGVEISRTSCTASRRRGKLIDAQFLALALMMLDGCSVTISNRTNPSGQAPSQWAAIDQLPIELHGNIPGLSRSDLTLRLRGTAPKLLFAANGA